MAHQTPPAGEIDDGAHAGRDGDWSFSLVALWQYRLTVAACVLVGTALGYLAYRQQAPVYQSTAQVLVTDNRRMLPTEGIVAPAAGDQAVTGSLLDTQVAIVRSPLVIDRALKESGLSNADFLKHQIVIGRGGDTNESKNASILQIGSRGPDPKSTRTVSAALAASYADFLQAKFASASNQTEQLLKQAREQIGGELKDLETEYEEFRSSELFLLDSEGKSSPARSRLAQVVQSLGQLQLEELGLRSERTFLTTALENETDLASLVLLITTTPKALEKAGAKTQQPGAVDQPEIRRQLITAYLNKLELEQRWGANHPELVDARSRIASLEQLLGVDAQTLMDGLRRSARTPEVGQEQARSQLREQVATYVKSLDNQLAEIDQRKGELQRMQDRLSVETQKLATAEARGERLRQQTERSRRFLDGIIDSLTALDLAGDDAGGVQAQIISPAEVGGKVAPKLMQSLGMGGVLGMLVGGLFAALLSWSDKGFRSPAEIRQVLGVPVVGEVPQFSAKRRGGRKSKGKQAGVHPTLMAYHRPASRDAESIRSIRTSLMVDHPDGHIAVQVTSPMPGDGKTTLACNLAASIARAGKRTLLVDADMRRPKVHLMFDANRDAGIVHLIHAREGSNGSNRFVQPFQPTPLEHLHVVTAEPGVADPSELLHSPHFAGLVEQLKREYDYVIIDTPPVLPCTDPSIVAAMADAVLVVLRIDKRTRPRATAAAEALRAVRANLVGIVVNGIEEGSRGYGSRGYYGYSYRGYESRNTYYGNGYYGDSSAVRDTVPAGQA